GYARRLLLDSRVVDVPMASNLTFVMLSSWKALFFNTLKMTCASRTTREHKSPESNKSGLTLLCGLAPRPTVIMGSSVPGKGWRFRPVWRKGMAMTIRPGSTIEFIGLSETNTIGYIGVQHAALLHGRP